MSKGHRIRLAYGLPPTASQQELDTARAEASAKVKALEKRASSPRMRRAHGLLPIESQEKGSAGRRESDGSVVYEPDKGE